MTRKTKQRLIKVLDAIIVIGVLASVVVGVILLRQQKSASNANHNDTINVIKQLQKSNDQNSRIIICMLQVPIAQRTPDLEANCRKAVNEQQQNGSTSTDPTATPTSTTVTTTVPATSSSPSSPANTNVSSPAQTSQATPNTPVQTPPSSQPTGVLAPVERIINNVTDTIKNIL